MGFPREFYFQTSKCNSKIIFTIIDSWYFPDQLFINFFVSVLNWSEKIVESIPYDHKPVFIDRSKKKLWRNSLTRRFWFRYKRSQNCLPDSFIVNVTKESSVTEMKVRTKFIEKIFHKFWFGCFRFSLTLLLCWSWRLSALDYVRLNQIMTEVCYLLNQFRLVSGTRIETEFI